MNTCDGTLYSYTKIDNDDFLKKFCAPVNAHDMTPKQAQEQKVSLRDHRSPLGIQLTQLRGVGRNEPCPCGSGKKFKFCHMNV